MSYKVLGRDFVAYKLLCDTMSGETLHKCLLTQNRKTMQTKMVI